MSSENRILLQLKKLDFDFDIVHNENFLSATAALHLALQRFAGFDCFPDVSLPNEARAAVGL